MQKSSIFAITVQAFDILDGALALAHLTLTIRRHVHLVIVDRAWQRAKADCGQL